MGRPNQSAAFLWGFNPAYSAVNVKTTGARGDGIADDTAAIQAAIDRVHAAGGGEVFLPEGVYRVTRPIVLPRTAHDPRDVVHLRGNSIRGTWIKADTGTFAAGDAVIQWESVIRRAWHQAIMCMTIEAPLVLDTHCIAYKMASDERTGPAIDAERAQFRFEELVLIGYNTHHQSLIELEGYSIGSYIREVYGDPHPGPDGPAHRLDERIYNTITLRTETTFTAPSTMIEGADKPGLFGATIVSLYGGIRNSGSAPVFDGRMAHCTVDTMICGTGIKGRDTGPAFAFRNCYATAISNTFSEGRSDDPAYLFDGCVSMTIDSLGRVGPAPVYPKWEPDKSYEVGDFVRPTDTTDNKAFRCTAAGVSGAVEPVWPGAGTVNDGTVTWTFHGKANGNGIEMKNCRGVYINGRATSKPDEPYSDFGALNAVIESNCRLCRLEGYQLNAASVAAVGTDELDIQGNTNFVEGVLSDLGEIYGVGRRTEWTTTVQAFPGESLRLLTNAGSAIAFQVLDGAGVPSTRWAMALGDLSPQTDAVVDFGRIDRRPRRVWTYGLAMGFRNSGASGTLLDSDGYIGVVDGRVMTLPAAANSRGQVYIIENTDPAGTPSTATLTRTGGDTINGAAADFNLTEGQMAIAIAGLGGDWRVKVIAS